MFVPWWWPSVAFWEWPADLQLSGAACLLKAQLRVAVQQLICQGNQGRGGFCRVLMPAPQLRNYGHLSSHPRLCLNRARFGFYDLPLCPALRRFVLLHVRKSD